MRKIVGLVLFGLVVLSKAVGIFTIVLKIVSTYTSHDPIYIPNKDDIYE